MAYKLSEIKHSDIHPDLIKERNGASFDREEMTHMFDGGKRRTMKRRDIETIVLGDPVFSFENDIYQSEKEMYDSAVHRGVRLFQLKKELGWNNEEYNFALAAIRGSIAFGLHWVMFIPTIASLGTPEQKAKWIPLAESLNIIGCYCQTEMGHGSNLRALETVARYDPTTEEFVLNTPKPSSIKWWPGGMGKTATHAVLFAQLEVGSQKLGFHSFIVPIRSNEDHSALPGVSVGQIGPLMSMSSLDNGYLSLKDVRIPRENMLMKNAQVTRDGRYISKASKQANYAALVFGRIGIVAYTLVSYKMGVITAVRYSAVRRQSTLKAGSPESQVLEYQTQQYKVLPALSTAYAMYFISQSLKQKYTDVTEGNHANHKELFQELHIVISGMKAVYCDLAVKYSTVCLRACGGHGYLKASGLPQTLGNNIAQSIVEGENTILYLQVSRYLMKMFTKIQSGMYVEEDSVRYLNDHNDVYRCPLQRETHCWNPNVLCKLYQQRSLGMIKQLFKKVADDTAAGLPLDIVTNRNLQFMVETAKAHCYLLAMKDFLRSVEMLNVSSSLMSVLENLSLLLVVNLMMEQSGQFLQTSAFNVEHMDWLNKTEVSLMAKVRPDAVALADAFDVHDFTLGSALGSYDGQAYSRLYKSAMAAPINKTPVQPAYSKYLKELLSAKPVSRM